MTRVRRLTRVNAMNTLLRNGLGFLLDSGLSLGETRFTHSVDAVSLYWPYTAPTSILSNAHLYIMFQNS